MAARTAHVETAILLLLLVVSIPAQTPASPQVDPANPSAASVGTSTRSTDAPLPDIVAMMHDVEINERKAEAIRKNYIFHSFENQTELDSHGQTKKNVNLEADYYWVNGVPVRRVVKKDGKPISPNEAAKEDQHIEREVAKARERREEGDAKGKDTDPRGNDEVTVSRLIELGSFTNPRRVMLNGRDTIAVDYAGNPKAQTHNRAEEVIRDIAGTAWVDEKDHVLVRAEGHFVNAFKIGGGLVANIRQGTQFTAEWTKVNDEVWLPARVYGAGAVRFLLFMNFNGEAGAVYRDYRKFRTTSTILPALPSVTIPPSQGTPAQPQ